MLGGWDHQATLAALRLAPGRELSSALDRLDFNVREQVPEAGLDVLRALTEDPDLLAAIDRLAATEEWRGIALTPGTGPSA